MNKSTTKQAQEESDEYSTGVSDAVLVERIRNDDDAAFGEIVHRYQAKLFRVIYRLVHDRELTEDLCQEVFLRAYERLVQFDNSRRFSPWLFQIGINLTLDYLRKKKRRKWISRFSEKSEDMQYDPGVSDPRDAIDLSGEITHLMNQIPEKYRTVLILHDVEHFSNTEIAAILNRKEPTIRWRLAVARQKFQQLWSARN